MDLFGIKRRRAEREAEARRIAEEEAAKRKALLEKRKKLIDGWIDHHNEEILEKGRKRQLEDIRLVEEINSKCPICGSRNRIHRFVRTKGELDGHSRGASLGKYYSSYGHIHGELDTFKVNECKDCGNQWEVATPRHNYAKDYVVDYHSPYEDGRIDYLYRRIKEVLKDGKWPKESSYVSTLEEFHNTPRMVLEYLIHTYFWSWSGAHSLDLTESQYEAQKGPILGSWSEDDKDWDAYLWEFSDETWEIVQKLLKRDEYEGFKYPTEN